MAIDVLKACDTQAAARLLGLSWGEAHGIKRRAVQRGLARRGPLTARYLGVDEKAFKRGHQYVIVVSDLATGHVHHVAESRTKDTLASFCAQHSETETGGIDAVAMDMWPAYINATKEALLNADSKIVFDRFHIMGKLTGAVGKVRRSEHKALMNAGDQRLKGSEYLWLRNVENRGTEQRQEFADLKGQNLKTARAWARKFFDRWYYWATHSRLEPIIAAAKTVKRHLKGLLNYSSIRSQTRPQRASTRRYRNSSVNHAAIAISITSNRIFCSNAAGWNSTRPPMQYPDEPFFY